MGAHLEVVEIGHLGIGASMETNDLFNKGLVVALQLLTVFLQVEDGSALRLDLVDVEVVNASNFVAGLGTLNVLFLLSVARL